MTKKQILFEILKNHFFEEWLEPYYCIKDDFKNDYNTEITIKELKALMKELRDMGLVKCMNCMNPDTGLAAGRINGLVFRWRKISRSLPKNGFTPNQSDLLRP